MKRETSVLFAIIAGTAVLAAGTAVLLYGTKSVNAPANSPNPQIVPPGGKACTMEAMLCPDGSYVGRTGPNCEFTPCPEPKPTPSGSSNCTSDADCPSSRYTCEATQGYGVVYPNDNQPQQNTIVKGECKLKEGNGCTMDSQCVSGLICHAGTCSQPQDGTCSGPGGKCPQGYQCIQDCGPPVARVDDPPPGYHCLADEVAKKPRMCPICLASTTLISTPGGDVNVRSLKAGDQVWTQDADGRKISAKVHEVSRSVTPRSHRVVHLVLADGRQVWLSPGHPTSDGRTAGSLVAGETYDGSMVTSTATEPYWDEYTYDLLPESATGRYWANGILFGSTLKH